MRDNKNRGDDGSGVTSRASGSLAAEHAALRPRIVELRTLLEGDFSWDEARVALVQFRSALQLHFALEESGGYLSEVLARAPEQATTLARLESEHSRMRADLTRLLAEALVAREKADLRQSVREFLTGLAEHEKCENEVSQLVLATDEPGGG